MKILIASTHIPPETAGAEKVAWEVIPQVAETVIKREIQKILDEEK